MKKILIILAAITIVALSFGGGWLLRAKMASRNLNSAMKTSNSFLSDLFNNQKDQAYNLTGDTYHQIVAKDAFDKLVQPLTDQSLEPGISTIYQNGDQFLFIQNYVDKDGNTTKVVTITLTNDRGLKIAGVSVN